MMKVVNSHVTDPYLIKKPLSCFDASDLDNAAKNILGDGYSYTMLWNDEVVAVVGALYNHPNCLGAWSVLSEKVYEVPVSFHKTLKRLIYGIFDKTGVNRLHTMVDVDNDAAIRHNEALGLMNEGVLKKIGMKGQDQVVFSLIRGNDGH